MKIHASKLIPVLFILPFIMHIPFVHAQNIQYQVESLGTLQTANGIEISTNKITFTVKNSDGTPFSGYQGLMPVIIDDQSSAFTVASPPTNGEGVTSLVFQNVARADSKIVFADLKSFTLQQAVQPLGCCQIEYNFGIAIPIIKPYGPIAICAQSLNQGNGISCAGLMVHGGEKSTFNTGAWTNLSQPCKTVNATNVKPLICGTGNPSLVNFGEDIGTTNGMTDSIFQEFFDCWKQESSNGTRPWTITLPVIDCPGGTISNCSRFVGAVRVNIMWVKYKDTTQPYYPTAMAAVSQYSPWESPEPGNETVSWQSFASYFHLRTLDNAPAPLEKRAIYFLPECRPYEPPPPITVCDYSCFTGFAADSMADCAILDSVYKREGIGNVGWSDNYICNQETLFCE